MSRRCHDQIDIEQQALVGCRKSSKFASSARKTRGETSLFLSSTNYKILMSLGAL